MEGLPRLRDFMARDLIVLQPDMDILQAMEVLLTNAISGACVVAPNGLLLGVLSKKDCLRAALNASYYQERGSTVSLHMNTDVETLDPNLDLVAVAERFLASSFRRFPVLETGQLVGQVSRADVLRALKDNWGSVAPAQKQ